MTSFVTFVDGKGICLSTTTQALLPKIKVTLNSQHNLLIQER